MVSPDMRDKPRDLLVESELPPGTPHIVCSVPEARYENFAEFVSGIRSEEVLQVVGLNNV